jgi:hypothetical protein
MPFPYDVELRRFYPGNTQDGGTGQRTTPVAFLNPHYCDFDARPLPVGVGWSTPIIRSTGFNSFMLIYETVPPVDLRVRITHYDPESIVLAVVWETPLAFGASPYLFGGPAALCRQHNFVAFRVFLFNDDVVDVTATARLWGSTRQ